MPPHTVIVTHAWVFVVIGVVCTTWSSQRDLDCLWSLANSGEAEDTIEVTVLTLMLIIQRKKKAKEEKGLENRKVLLHVKEKQN